MKYKDSGDTIFPPYAIHKFEGGIKVGIVGMTLEGTPDIVTPAGISTVNFFDEADASTHSCPSSRRRASRRSSCCCTRVGRRASAGNGAGSVAEINECGNRQSGSCRRSSSGWTTRSTSSVTGHTNWAVNCVLDGKIVTGAASNGRLVTDIDLTVSRATKDVVVGLRSTTGSSRGTLPRRPT